MAFHTLDFALFLVGTLVLTWGLARYNMLRLVVLLIASYFFYMSSRPIYILLILGSTCVDYCCGILIWDTDSKRKKKWLLAISLTGNLGLLGTFKYYDFFIDSIQTLLHGWGWLDTGTSLPMLQAMLPVGISFYTFQTMAYSVDVYRGNQVPIRNFVKFALFVSFFPQLVAGPIVLAKHLVPQFESRPRITRDQVSDGVFLIMKGLVKKLAIADFLALNIVDRVYDKPELFTVAEVMLALYAYSMQIYCDFSGYTDMAIGSAKLFGYELPENFDRPYQAESVAKFWRRWHMTLSRWVREYIYFPLGGTHKGEARAYVNIMIALVAMGIWHGANWTFFWYGVIHGCVVGINRWHNQRRRRLGLPYELRGFKLVWRVFLAFTFVTIARILFRSQDLGQAWDVTRHLIGYGTANIGLVDAWHYAADVGGVGLDGVRAFFGVLFGHIHWKVWAVLVVSYTIHWLPRRLVTQAGMRFRRLPAVVQGLILGVILLWMVHLANTQPVPFIYFQF